MPTYKKLEVPEFACSVDELTLSKLNRQERYLVETLSKMEAREAWLLSAATENNRIAIETAEELNKLKQKVQGLLLKGAGAVILAVIGALVRWYIAK